MILVISGLFLLFGFLLIVLGCIDDDTDIGSIGAVILFSSILCGFGLCGMVVEVSSKYIIPTKVELAVIDSTLVVSADHKIYTSTNKDMCRLADTSNIVLRVSKNSYGGEIERTIELRRDE